MESLNMVSTATDSKLVAFFERPDVQRAICCAEKSKVRSILTMYSGTGRLTPYFAGYLRGLASQLSITPATPLAAKRVSDRGLGDTVHRALKRLGFKECDPCAKRREVLNRAVPYGGNR